MIVDRAMTDQSVSRLRAQPLDASRFALETGERWYVAMTVPRKERLAATQLDNQRYRSFLPLQLETRRHARKFTTVLAPVFPRYIFVILDIERQRWRSVNGTFGVQRLITDGERPLAVAPGIVETLVQSSDQRGALIYKGDELAIGDPVKLVSGPFAGSLGILQRLDGAGRVQILLSLLGGPVKVTAAREMVAAAR
ncbi:MAG: transcription termination/antitermination NusG family protein [Roseiarcus sp.]|jgi:transcriptional antiterminator RfaH